MDIVPVAKESQKQQQNRDQQQPRRFGRINRVPPMPVRMIVLREGPAHADIVALRAVALGQRV
jgi:hypothetical protein